MKRDTEGYLKDCVSSKPPFLITVFIFSGGGRGMSYHFKRPLIPQHGVLATLCRAPFCIPTLLIAVDSDPLSVKSRVNETIPLFC